MKISKLNRAHVAVTVAALGYFVDIYDLILFSIVRVPSLKDLGFQDAALFSNGVWLLNMQMSGMLLGGLIWGILGDKRGRLSVLFGSIILYSVANIANGMVESMWSYSMWRFIAGIGLAGELGAGITLVAEVMSKEKRGYGTTIVASFGICGALLAANVAEWLDWRNAFYVGGVLGLALLVLRIAVFESHMFEECKKAPAKRGDFLYLLKSTKNFAKYMRCILIGVPIWFVIAILITFSPEFAGVLNVQGTVSAGKAVMYCYLGLAIGDLASGLLSQWLRSRRRVVFAFLTLTAMTIVIYLTWTGLSVAWFYGICCLLGFATGYWALFVTIGTEQFGTNLRATVTTTVPNFVRGAVVPMTASFAVLKTSIGIIPAAASLAVVVMAIAYGSLYGMEETFGKDLGYLED
jgi:MFS transporter, putative metabolite:H+ symporter